jgi:trk system potassium uptake protein TrkH
LKVIRIVILAKYIHRRLIMVFNPSIVMPVKIDGTSLPDSVVSRAISLTLLYAMLVIGGFMAISTMEIVPITALSSVLACIGNVGPGFGLHASNSFLLPFRISLLIVKGWGYNLIVSSLSQGEGY